MRRLLVTTFLVAAVLTGGGQMTASAAEQGVGPSPGTTGQERACQATSENKGKSQAKGLECAPAATLTYVGTDTAPGCVFTVTGTGLLPGSEVTEVQGTAPDLGYLVFGTASETGDFSFSFLDFLGGRPCQEFLQYNIRVTGTTASGQPITSPFTVAGA